MSDGLRKVGFGRRDIDSIVDGATRGDNDPKKGSQKGKNPKDQKKKKAKYGDGLRSA